MQPMEVKTNSGGAGDRPDLRIRRTRKALWEALIDLVVEKGLHAITITDITRRAMVNRSTFYAHFEDKEDLLNQGMSDRLAELLDEVPPPPEDTAAIDLNQPHPAAVRAFEHVQENERFYRAMILEGRLAGFLRRFEESAKTHITSRMDQLRQQLHPTVPVDALLHVIVGTQVSLIQWWLERGMQPGPHEMAVYLARTITLGVYTCMGLPLPAAPEASESPPGPESTPAAASLESPAAGESPSAPIPTEQS